jgi:hypothetical protein
MRNQVEIEKIANQESKTCNQQMYLQIDFFLIPILFIWRFIHVVSGTDSDNGQTIGASIMIQYFIYVALLCGGYLLYKLLGRHLDQLWEKKKLLF